ncbi:MAG: ABC transporter permease, partial [Verrucomicrobiae bacterium]|nr:ABC transporter permease [Verrucomicrobiae bacterium]
GFTAVAVLTLALGIGANTAIFTVINTVLLRSLPVKNPDELVQVIVTSASGQPNYTFSYPFYEQLRDGGQSLSGLFAAGGVGEKDRLKVAGGGDVETEFVRAQPVSGNFFPVLGVSAALGRTFTAEDDRAGNPQAIAVISHSFWQRRFAGDPSVVGQAITFNDVPFTIVGITPPDFFGFQPGQTPELWWPLQMVSQVDQDPAAGRLKEGQQWLRLMGRRSPGVEQRQAEAELSMIFQRYRENYLTTRGENWSANEREGFLAQKFTLRSGHAGWTGLRDGLRLPLFILMSVVAAVLLIACANVASLLLARAAAREREFSVRNALGAGRLRLMRQLLTESLLLAGLGGLLGLLCAQGGTRLLPLVMRLPSDPISLSLTPDLRVLLFTLAATLLTGIFFGLAPAFRGSRIEVASALKGAGGSISGHASRQRFHQSLIIGQVALSLVLLIGAGLFIRTLQNLKGLDAGFSRENVILFNLNFTERVDA